MIRLITISGLDGSGKSTQVQLLKEHFEANSKKVFYFHVIQFSLLQRFKSTLKQGESSSGEAINRASLLGILIRKMMLPIDIARFRRLLKQLDKNDYDVVISDRYFYDVLINIAYLEESSRFLRISIPKPDVALYLEVEPVKILTRERVPEQGKSYLVRKFDLYSQFAKEQKLEVVNGSASKQIIHRRILDILQHFISA